jgi:hypothetical protein
VAAAATNLQVVVEVLKNLQLEEVATQAAETRAAAAVLQPSVDRLD